MTSPISDEAVRTACQAYLREGEFSFRDRIAFALESMVAGRALADAEPVVAELIEALEAALEIFEMTEDANTPPSDAWAWTYQARAALDKAKPVQDDSEVRELRAEIDRLRAEKANCEKNCLGYPTPGTSRWCRIERAEKLETELDRLRADYDTVVVTGKSEPYVLVRPLEETLKDGRPLLDEVVAQGAYVHLEKMDTGVFWMAVEANGQHIHVWFHRKGRDIQVTYHDEAERAARVETPADAERQVQEYLARAKGSVIHVAANGDAALGRVPAPDSARLKQRD